MAVDRISLFVTSINMFRILCSFSYRIREAAYAAPVLYRTIPRGIGGADGSVTVFMSHVVKICRPASDPSIYTLLHRIPTHAVRITNKLPLKIDGTGFSTLNIIPVCSVRLPSDVAELKSAIRSVLNALVVLHENKFIHRDVRWPNVLCDANNCWLLSDFELSSKIDQPLPAQFLNNSNFAPEVCHGQPCKPSLDIWQVGRLIQLWLRDRQLNDQSASEFAELLMNQDSAGRPSAEMALSNQWLHV
jgi:serine/threonine protein kinase